MPRKKTPGGTGGGAGTHTGHTGAHGHTDHTDEPHNHPNPPTHPHDPTWSRVATRTESAAGSAAQQPQPRSRTLPAADSEEAAPSEPDPAASRSQSASPRLLEGLEGAVGGNESARSRRVGTLASSQVKSSRASGRGVGFFPIQERVDFNTRYHDTS